MMDRDSKKTFVSHLNAEMGKSQSVAVASFSALSVKELESLRIQAHEKGAFVKVTQNRLTKLALKGTRFEGIQSLFAGPTLIAYSDDPIISHKILFGFAKKNGKVIILGGASEDKILDADGVKDMALLPTLDEARAKICAVLVAPHAKMARLFKVYAERTTTN
jgi:large subunit ribosomal protein L10